MSESGPLSKPVRTALLALAILLAAGIGARLVFGGGAADGDETASTSQAKLNGQPGATPAIWMTKEQVEALDLKTAAATPTQAGEARVLHGVVLDPFLFIDLSAKRASAAATWKAARFAATAAHAELDRVTALHASGHGASDKALQEAQRAAADADAALATAQGEAAKAQAAWAQTGLRSIEGLADFHRVVVRMDLPLGMPAPSPLPHTLNGTSPGLGNSFTLHVLGLAPGGSPLTGGLAVLAEAPGAGLRPGLPVDATLPGKKESRVMVPRSAVVWSGGHALVFLEVGENCFEPRLVDIAFPTEDGLALASGLSVGDKVVTQGALAVQGEYARLSEGTAIGAGGV